MKLNFRVTLMRIFFFTTTTFYSCDKKEVGNTSVITPQVPVTSTGAKSYFVSDGTGSDANTGLSISAPLKQSPQGKI